VLESEVSGLIKAEVITINPEGVAEAEVELVPAEQELTFVMNNRHEARFSCAPHRVRSLVAGWLAGEGVVSAPSDVISLEIDMKTQRVDITLTPQCLDQLEQRLASEKGLLAGDSPFERRTDTSLELEPEIVDKLAENFRKLFLSLKSAERMCYLCCIASPQEILTYGEGFHRINAMYRAIGELALNGQSTLNKVALVNFGLSRSHAIRLARTGISIAVCLAPPTSAAIEVANNYYLTIVQAAMGSGTRVYSSPWRVI